MFELLFISTKAKAYGLRFQRVAVPGVPVGPVHLVLGEAVELLVAYRCSGSATG